MSDFLGFSSEREYFRLAALRLPRLIQGEPSTSGETPPTLLIQFNVSNHVHLRDKARVILKKCNRLDQFLKGLSMCLWIRRGFLSGLVFSMLNFIQVSGLSF